jgi:hypothetical protein
MSDDAYIGRLLLGVAHAFTPLANALASPASLCALLGSLGWVFDPTSSTSQVSVLSSLAASLETLDTDATSLATALTQAGDPEAIVAAVAGALPGAIQAVQSVISDIQALSASTADPGWPEPLGDTDFWAAFPAEVLDLLIYQQLATNAPQALALVRALGIFMMETPAPSPSRPTPKPIPVAYWERLGSIFSAPLSTLYSAFFIAEPYALGSLLDALGSAAFALGLPATVAPPDTDFSGTSSVPGQANLSDGDGILVVPLWSEIASTEAGQASAFLTLVIVPVAGATGQPPTGILAYPAAGGTLSAGPFMFSDQIGLTLTGSLTSDQAITVALGQAGFSVNTSLSDTDLAGAIRLDINSGSQPWVVFGSPDDSNLTISAVHAAISVGGGVTAPTFSVEFGIDTGSLVLSLGDADGFLQSVLGQSQQTINLATTASWGPSTGLTLSGGPGLQASIPTRLELASVLSVDTLGIALGGNGPAATLAVTISGSLSLGPIVISAQGLGLQGSLAAAAAGVQGNLGPLDLGVAFKPPNGLGLSLDADPVSGTGFVAFDATNARYLGAIALAVGDVAISAVGVLDTELPGGAPGYSLIIVASADFPPVELGFGFSLVGIGGLVGVNRTTNVPSLQALARAGQLDSLMFPANLANRAPQVAASLEQVFPAAQGHFIIGPAVRIEWGTAGIVDAEVGVFIELSDSGGGITLLRVAVLGWVHLTLPDAILPIADLTLDVLGVIDLAAKTLSLDAGLRNSTIAGFPLTGQAALRASWGTSPSFVFAVGGFNPHFAVPTGFPALQRLALAIGGNDPRLRLSAYLALTSNTVQFGCAADLYASAGPAAVSASLTFDALLQFNPFGLIVNLTIAATVLLGGSPVLSLSLDLNVTGPEPWTVTGSASFQVLFCSFTVPISITAGPQAGPAAPPPAVDLDGNLTTALGDPHSWQTGPPTGRTLVTVCSQNGASPAVHPLGSLTVRQNAVPLEQRLECYGAELLDAPCTYQVTGATLGEAPVPATDVTDFFAPAQFLTMTDAQKLSAPSFELMTAGTTLGSTALSLAATPGASGAAPTVVDTRPSQTWDVLLLDSPDPSPAPAVASAAVGPARLATAAVAPPASTTALPPALLAAQLSGAAAAVNGPGGQGQAAYAGPVSGIVVEQPSYAVVGMNLAALGPAGAISMRIPTVVAAVSSQIGSTSGTIGQDWQVVYTSEVPG